MCAKTPYCFLIPANPGFHILFQLKPHPMSIFMLTFLWQNLTIIPPCSHLEMPSTLTFMVYCPGFPFSLSHPYKPSWEQSLSLCSRLPSLFSRHTFLVSLFHIIMLSNCFWADFSHFSVSHSYWFSGPVWLRVYWVCPLVWHTDRGLEKPLHSTLGTCTSPLSVTAFNSNSKTPASDFIISNLFSTLQTEWLFYINQVIPLSFLKNDFL